MDGYARTDSAGVSDTLPDLMYAGGPGLQSRGRLTSAASVKRRRWRAVVCEALFSRPLARQTPAAPAVKTDQQ